MKKSQKITLVLISALLASCSKEAINEKEEQEVYMRGDETASYEQTHCHHNGNNMLLWYLAFRPYGIYQNGGYSHVGMYSRSLSESSNIGRSSTKTSVMTSSSSRIVSSARVGSSSRGGFGGSSHGSSAS